MSEYHFPIPGHEEDKIIIFTRRHWASMLGIVVLVSFLIFFPIIFIILSLILQINFFSGLDVHFLVLGLSVYYLIMVAVAFVEWITYYYDIFILTQDEIIDITQVGIFDRRIAEVSILRIQDVSARSRGLLPTLFAYGDVIAESAGEDSHTYIIDDIPNPVEVANRIMDQHNERISSEERVREVGIAEGDLRGRRMEKTEEIIPEFKGKPLPRSESPPKTTASSPPEMPLQTPLSTTNEQDEIPMEDLKKGEESEDEGEISKDDLNQGGEVKF